MNFNDYISDYSRQVEKAIPCVGVKHDTYLAEKANHLLKLAIDNFSNLNEVRVLDVGCGVGLMERFFNGRFRRLVGVDVASDAVEQARAGGTDAEFIHYDGEQLPFEDNQFDIAFACCVFHHVAPAQRAALTREMARVIAPGGLVIIFEHNPWNPITRLVVSRCEFDRDAILLGSAETSRLLAGAGLQNLSCRQLLYFPWRSRIWVALESMISWLPLGAQYGLSGSKPAIQPATCAVEPSLANVQGNPASVF